MASSKSVKMNSLLKILRLLNSGLMRTPAQLAEALEVTERTVYRYISSLQSAGYPIYFDRQKNSYRFSDGYSLTEHSGNVELFQAVTLKSRMTDSLSVGLASYDHTGQCVVVNDAAAALIGVSREMLLRENYNDLESWRKSGMSVMALEVMTTGAEAHGEFRLTTSFGKEMWLCCSMSRFMQQGKHHLMLVFQDISVLKNTELELRKTQELMRQFLENSPVYTYIKDAESRPVMLSRNFEMFFNRPLDQIIGKEMAELLPPETARRVVIEDREVLESDTVFQEDDEICGRHYSTTKFAIHHESGDYTGGFILDITERKQNEAQARECAEQFRVLAREAVMDKLLQQVVNEAADAILISDREGIITFWNRGAERIFDHTAAEAVGQSLDLIIPENLRNRHWEGYRRVMAAGETKYQTGLLSSPGIRKDGTRVSLEFSMVLLHDENGAMQGCASIMRDVTERWRKEQELKAKLTACETKPAGSAES
jgi:PAS domain S-box-containing protein